MEQTCGISPPSLLFTHNAHDVAIHEGLDITVGKPLENTTKTVSPSLLSTLSTFTTLTRYQEDLTKYLEKGE